MIWYVKREPEGRYSGRGLELEVREDAVSYLHGEELVRLGIVSMGSSRKRCNGHDAFTAHSCGAGDPTT